MSMQPLLHRGGLSGISRLLENYDNYLSQRPLCSSSSEFTPTFDVRENADGYQLEGELPGVKLDDIKVEYTNPRTMSIRGHTERASKGKEGSWWVSERSIGDFRRSFSFPSPVNQDETNARLKDGILFVTVPKTAARSETKKIKVEVEE